MTCTSVLELGTVAPAKCTEVAPLDWDTAVPPPAYPPAEQAIGKEILNAVSAEFAVGVTFTRPETVTTLPVLVQAAPPPALEMVLTLVTAVRHRDPPSASGHRCRG